MSNATELEVIAMDPESLSGAALSFAVAEAMQYRTGIVEMTDNAMGVVLPSGQMKYIQGGRAIDWIRSGRWAPAEDWSQGGPLKKELRIDTSYLNDGRVAARIGADPETIGADELEAAMRHLVRHKLGPVVEIPAMLLPAMKATPPKPSVR